MRDLLKPDPKQLREPSRRKLLRVAMVTALGFAIYGFTVGFWRSPVMGLYVAIKMPMLIAATLACNGLFNGLMGLVLGSGLGFRQSLQSLLTAFSITALILASIAPVTFFLALNAPSPEAANAVDAHAGYLLAHTTLIAIAGCIGVLRLSQLLRAWCPTPQIALSTLTAWLVGNAFIGAQFSWIFRPFFGSPNLKVAFLRDDPMRGSFYEAVWNSISHLVENLGARTLPFVILILLALIAAFSAFQQNRQTPKP